MYLTLRVIETYSSLPYDIVNANIVNTFNRLDEHLTNEELQDNY